jgi:protein SCO1
MSHRKTYWPGRPPVAPRPAASLRATLLAAALIGVSLLAAGCGAGGGAGKAGAASSASAAGKLDAPGELEPPRMAPQIALRNYNGEMVRLSQFRGRAVLLTFIYDHCPDTCPLIVAKLHQALGLLGSKAKQVEVVAVSVDPVGDTPKTVRAFLVKHDVLGQMKYLIGSKAQLAPVWKRYEISSEASPQSREVSHTALVYGITAKGVQLALYDQEFQPSEIAHDVQILARM